MEFQDLTDFETHYTSEDHQQALALRRFPAGRAHLLHHGHGAEDHHEVPVRAWVAAHVEVHAAAPELQKQRVPLVDQMRGGAHGGRFNLGGVECGSREMFF